LKTRWDYIKINIERNPADRLIRRGIQLIDNRFNSTKPFSAKDVNQRGKEIQR